VTRSQVPKSEAPPPQGRRPVLGDPGPGTPIFSGCARFSRHLGHPPANLNLLASLLEIDQDGCIEQRWVRIPAE
jgi:hypothetical protein